MALLSTVLLPVSMAGQALVSRFFRRGAPPLNVFVAASLARLVQGGISVGLVSWLRAAHASGGGLPLALNAACFMALALGALSNSAMFVAQMAFFNRVSDARIGGTYLTMLNTISNLGGQWPGTVILAAKGALESQVTYNGYYVSYRDGFYPVACASLLFGAAFLALFSRRIIALQDRPPSDWRVTRSVGDDEDAGGDN